MTAVSEPRVLVVDDEKAHAEAVCTVLSARGFVTVGCTSGAEAIAALRESRFELLLVDLNMPGMDGIEVLRTALEIDPGLIAIIMTGKATVSSAVEAMKSGALDYIVKPLKVSTVLPVLNRALEVRQLRSDKSALEERVRQQMADLQAANSDLDAFAFSVSHDLRAPLHVIAGFNGLLIQKYSSKLDEAGIHYLQRIRSATKQMSQLIEGLLKLSRLGRQAVDRSEVDVAKLVRDAFDELPKTESGTVVVLNVKAGLPPAHADSVLLRQVFANLLSNAIKFSQRNAAPVVTVGFDLSKGPTTYFVHDNGAGFDSALAQKMFQPFQRFHSNEEFEGIGLGLSIAQRIVIRHGGRIWAESQPGAGACFYFTLDGGQAAI